MQILFAWVTGQYRQLGGFTFSWRKPYTRKNANTPLAHIMYWLVRDASEISIMFHTFTGCLLGKETKRHVIGTRATEPDVFEIGSHHLLANM